MKTSIAIAGAVGLLAAATATAQTFTFPLDPKASYLRTNNDVSAAPLVLNLASLGIAPGQWLRIGTTGFYRSIAGGPDTYRSLAGVFSSSTTLLPETDQFRVVDAIAAGPAVQSGPTFFGSLPIDIPEDFDCSRLGWASSMDVMVPANATHLFLGTHESFFSDNVDPNGDFAAVVTLLAPPTMPGTGEHLVLKSAVGGAPALTPDVHLAPPGTTMTVELGYPVGLIDGSIYALVADVVATGTPPPNPIPGLWTPNLILLKAGLLPSTPSWTDTWSLVTTSGYAGTTVIVQGIALTAAARNGLFESTAAHAFLWF